MLCYYGCGGVAVNELKNGKPCCSKSHNSCPSNRKKNSEKQKISHNFTVRAQFVYKECFYCKKEIASCNIKKHEMTCYLNPKNLIQCEICNNPIKDYKNNKTCGHTCAREKFKDMYLEFSSMVWSDETKERVREKSGGVIHYTTVCWSHHEKKCIICGEDKIVAVHHIDENKNNNSPENLIPLCMTHHVYYHSRYKHLVEEQILNYQKEFIAGWTGGGSSTVS